MKKNILPFKVRKHEKINKELKHFSIPKGFIDVPIFTSIEDSPQSKGSYGFGDPFGIAFENNLDFYCKYPNSSVALEELKFKNIDLVGRLYHDQKNSEKSPGVSSDS